MAHVCLLSCLWAQHLWPNWAGYTRTNTALAGFNMGQSVEAGGRGGGAPVLGSAAGYHFFTASVMWGKRYGSILFSLAGARPGTLGADRHCR